MKTASAIDGLGKILDFWASEVKEGWIKMRLKRPDNSGGSEMKAQRRQMLFADLLKISSRVRGL